MGTQAQRRWRRSPPERGPAFMGRQLELNPFAVFLTIAFCTWLLEPIGAFLAVPLLIALTVTLGHAFAEQMPDLPQ